ncbi:MULTISPECIES: AfsA-related hotdog domain-containing protein [Actinomycetes]|uniref:AfsA-related hotdog domain-containing protein n=1 Tax=Actinomycetes TaxID=1760 RepID=UPI0036533BE3
MTVASTTAPELGHGTATRHLIHCPPSWDRYLLEAPGSSEEHFVLAGDIPAAHPLFSDGPGRFHDPQLLTDTVREIGEFVGHQYFGVPGDRVGLFHRFALELTDLAGWRTGADRARLLTRIAVAPVNVVGGVPRGLEFRLEAAIDDVVCAAGSAGLVFLMPVLYRNHVAQSRRAPDGPAAPGPSWPVAPAEVGRRSPGNVVVREAAPVAPGPRADYGPGPGRLDTWIVPRPCDPVFAGPGGGGLSGLLLLEGMRQSALLAAARTGGIEAGRAVQDSFEVRFSGYAADDVALRCAAVVRAGRTAAEVALTVTQNGRPVADARARVVQDY